MSPRTRLGTLRGCYSSCPAHVNPFTLEWEAELEQLNSFKFPGSQDHWGSFTFIARPHYCQERSETVSGEQGSSRQHSDRKCDRLTRSTEVSAGLYEKYRSIRHLTRDTWVTATMWWDTEVSERERERTLLPPELKVLPTLWEKYRHIYHLTREESISCCIQEIQTYLTSNKRYRSIWRLTRDMVCWLEKVPREVELSSFPMKSGVCVLCHFLN